MLLLPLCVAYYHPDPHSSLSESPVHLACVVKPGPNDEAPEKVGERERNKRMNRVTSI